MSQEQADYNLSAFSKPADLEVQDEALFTEYAKVALAGLIPKASQQMSFNHLALDASKIAHSMVIQHKEKFKRGNHDRKNN